MTYAPQPIKALAAYWVSQGGTNLGIVGDTRHQQRGVSYHLGRSQLTVSAYSRKTGRDRDGLTEAASALDLGKLNGNLGQLRAFSRWFVNRCRTNAPGTQDVREFIYSPDGTRVLRWDRERGVNSAPRTGEADNSHLGHSHISFYRDSEKRSKVGLFRPYFEPAQPVTPPATPAKEEPVADRTLAAASTRLRYADNELASGDTQAALGHLLKAQEYISRVAAPLAPPTPDDPDVDVTAELSDDRNVAIHQLLAQTGHPTTFDDQGRSVGSDPSAVKADATPEQIEALTVLGYFGGPPQGVYPEPWLRYYEISSVTGVDTTGQPLGGGPVLKAGFDTGNAVWTHWLANR